MSAATRLLPLCLALFLCRAAAEEDPLVTRFGKASEEAAKARAAKPVTPGGAGALASLNQESGDMIARAQFAVVQIRTRMGFGTGFVVHPTGLVVTNAHVLQETGARDDAQGEAGAAKGSGVLASFGDGQSILPAKILASNAKKDLALLQLPTRSAPYPFLRLGDSKRARVGDTVFALGHPMGLGQTVTRGIIGRLVESFPQMNLTNSFIQTDAAINPGNSGGPLLDASGRVIGVNTSIVSKSGMSAGLGFAIASLELARALNQFDLMGHIDSPSLGIIFRIQGSRLVPRFGLGATRLAQPSGGAAVETVRPGSPAAKAGIRAGDVIIGVDDFNLPPDAEDAYQKLAFYLGAKMPGDVIRVILLRNWQSAAVPVTLGR